jgi:hypothetical protein
MSAELSLIRPLGIAHELTSARFPEPAYPLPMMTPSAEAMDAAVLLPPT